MIEIWCGLPTSECLKTTVKALCMLIRTACHRRNTRRPCGSEPALASQPAWRGSSSASSARPALATGPARRAAWCTSAGRSRAASPATAGPAPHRPLQHTCQTAAPEASTAFWTCRTDKLWKKCNARMRGGMDAMAATTTRQ